MTHDVLTGIVLVLVLGIGSQWLAWRVRVPSILLLLVVGFLAGPVTRIIDPVGLQGDWVFAFVSISIGIILFEGGLSLRLSELREVGTAVLNLITIGVLITWTLASIGAYFILELNVSLSILLGAILTVTGPTVVIPLLRHVRPTGRVRAIAKWEGITIDPVGAILAVLVLDAILILNDAGAAGIELTGFGPVALHAMKGSAADHHDEHWNQCSRGRNVDHSLTTTACARLSSELDCPGHRGRYIRPVKCSPARVGTA